MPTKTYDVTLSFPGAIGVQNKVRVIQTVSGAVTAAESAPSGSSEGISVTGRSKVSLGVGVFTNITDVDLVLWGLSGGTWTKVDGGSFSTLTAATFLGVFDVRGYDRVFLQVSAITTGGSPSLTREYKILGADPPRLPRAHVANKDLADLTGFSTFLMTFYPTYASLPTTFVEDGDVAAVSTGTARDVYKYVGTVGGDSVGIWVPSDLANRITDYVRDGSSNPLKISMSNGVGTDTKSILTGRGWTESNTGDAAIDDSTGDLRFLGGTSDTNQATLTFNYTSSLFQKRVLIIADIDVVTPSGGNTSGYVAIEGTSPQTYTTQWTWAWAGTSNLTLLFGNNGFNTQGGHGSLTLDSFERMFGEISPGETSTFGAKRPHRLWRSSLGRTKNDNVAVVTGSGGSGTFFELAADNDGGTQPDFRVREFHAFILS